MISKVKRFFFNSFKILLLLLIIASIMVATLFTYSKEWIDTNNQAIKLICWIIGIGGVWTITNKTLHELHERRRNAVYGFYFNLTAYLDRLENMITKKADGEIRVFDYHFRIHKGGLNELSSTEKTNIGDIVSKFLNFIYTQQNVVPPNIDVRKEINKWYNSLENIIGFLCKLDNICKGLPVEEMEHKPYVNYIDAVSTDIKIVKTQIRVFQQKLFGFSYDQVDNSKLEMS